MLILRIRYANEVLEDSLVIVWCSSIKTVWQQSRQIPEQEWSHSDLLVPTAHHISWNADISSTLKCLFNGSIRLLLSRHHTELWWREWDREREKSYNNWISTHHTNWIVTAIVNWMPLLTLKWMAYLCYQWKQNESHHDYSEQNRPTPWAACCQLAQSPEQVAKMDQ